MSRRDDLPDGARHEDVGAVPDRIAAANMRGVQAFHRGDNHAAMAAYQEAIAALTLADDHLAPVLYENLGLALFNTGQYHAAARAFLRALDGDPSRREQAAMFLVTAWVAIDHWPNAVRQFEHVRARWSMPHPHGWTRARLADGYRRWRLYHSKSRVC